MKDGRLFLRIGREPLDHLIILVAQIPAAGRAVEAELSALLSYLEKMADQFERPAETDTVPPYPSLI